MLQPGPEVSNSLPQHQNIAMPESDENPGVLILAGGQSRRMGVDKALLPFQGGTFLETIVNQCLPWSPHIVISVGIGQQSAYVNRFGSQNLFRDVTWVEDTTFNKGPLSGIEAGLKTLERNCRYAFVTGCDVPVVKVDLVRELYRRAIDTDATAVTPVDGKRLFGMTSLYRTDSWPIAGQLIQQDRLRVSALCEILDTERIELDHLRAFDPDLESFLNINHPQQYLDFLLSRGCRPTQDLLKKLDIAR